MISYYNTYGKVSMTTAYFAELVSAAAKSGFGVAGMTPGGMSDSLISLVQPDFPEKGVRVTEENGKLIIRLHLKVSYGVNIPATIQSAIHKVQYVVEEATGLAVKRIDVAVDDILA